MVNKPIAVAVAILYTEEHFLLQLRDDVPGIAYPGHWGLFGGHIEAGETPIVALQRELCEEIGYTTYQIIKFRTYEDSGVIRHVFSAHLTVTLDQLVLSEGWDMDLVTLDSIRQGSCYSHKADSVRPIAKPHQQILLDFRLDTGKTGTKFY